jgi:dipeptidyl aminopeptidase/acylaminoacyl peptidase
MKAQLVCFLLALTALSLLLCGAQAQVSNLHIPLDVDGPRRLIAARDLMSLRELGGMLGAGLSVSPDGNYLAFELHQADVAINDYRVAWFVGSTAREGIPVNVGDGRDATLFRHSLPDGEIHGAWITDYAKWSPDSLSIAYRKRLDGETQVWWSSRDGKEQEQLTHNAADVETFYWSHDGLRLYFITDAPRTELREVAESRYRAGHVYDYNKNWSVIEAKPGYPPYALTGGKPVVWVLDIESGIERTATADEREEYKQLAEPDTPAAKPPRARRATWTEDERGVAWVQADNPEKQGLNPPLTLYASLATDGSNPVRCPAEECTGIFDLSRPLRDGIHWDSIEDEIYFVRKEGMGYSRRTLYGWHIGDEQVRRILTTDEWISDCSIIRDRALCFRETPSYPRTVVSIDLADGSIETLVDPNPEFRNLIIGDVELFEWENSHGYEAFGYLVKPPDYVPGKRYPLVFVGYRARYALRGGIGEEYPIHLLVANGFMVLVYEKPMPHEAYEIYSDSLDIGRARYGPDLFDVRMPLASFRSAIGILTDRGLVDPARVAVTGLSNGVGHVNYSLIRSDLFAAAIASGSDFGPNARVLIGASGDFREYLRVIGAGPYPGPHAFLFPHISLKLNAERVTAPLLVNVSDSEHAWALEEIVALIEHDKPVEMVVYPDEGHVKWQPAHRASIYERNIDWLNFWLQGIEDSNPDKTRQYARWHNLRDKQLDREAEGTIAEGAN